MSAPKNASSASLRLALLLATTLQLATACTDAGDGGTTVASSATDAGAADAAGSEGADATADADAPAWPDPIGACRYKNPFGGTSECKAYTGPGWDDASARADCAAPMPGTEGTFSEGGCDEAPALGDCLV